MIRPASDPPGRLIDAQDGRPEARKWHQFTDIHCHLLPGLDDGPQTMAQALALSRRLVAEGIATVIATPHQLGRFDGRNDAVQIRRAVHRLNAALKERGLSLSVLPGGEVRVDERIGRLLEDDRVLTLADGGKYILLELPYEIFVNIEPLLAELSSMGIQAVISHPEKSGPLAARPSVLLRWLDYSAHLQITASSLVGNCGPAAQRAAWHFLSAGWASLVATDAHDTQVHKPQMRAAFRYIRTRLGHDIARLACIQNPARVVAGQEVVPIRLHNRQKVGR
jgi:protein-tyrosine phosphatase